MLLWTELCPLWNHGWSPKPSVQCLEVGLWEMIRLWELDHKEGWVPKNWNFQTVVLEETLESPLDCKEIQQVCPKGLMLKLKLQYFGHLIWRPNSLEKTLMLAKTEGRRRRRRQRMRWLDGITDSVDMSFSKLQEILEDREPWCAAVHEVTKSLTQLRDSRITTRQSSYLLVPTCFPGTLCSEQWPHVWLGALSLWSEELDFDDRAKGSSPYLLLEAGWRRFI